MEGVGDWQGRVHLEEEAEGLESQEGLHQRALVAEEQPTCARPVAWFAEAGL